MKMANKKVVITGAEAAAAAMKQINPEVVAAYPITPQTPIIQKFSQYVADGEVDTEFVLVESEHSAMSATVGAASAGVRAMTCTASQGLALMHEIIPVASGLRLPIVMSVANRALSAPINIHCDHSDSMAARDHSWIQLYTENPQEVYETTLLAIRLAEHPDIQLPVMVCQDGFINSHCSKNVTLFDNSIVKKFLGKYKPRINLLDTDNPITVGPLALFDYYFEMKYQQSKAMKLVPKVFLDVGKELSKITNNKYNFFEEYKLKDAKYAIIVLSSTAGTGKEVVNQLRAKGKKVGLLKIKMFRPFPYKKIAKALSHLKKAAVLDRAESFGADAPLYSEIKNSLYHTKKRPILQSYIYGLGGRDTQEKDIQDLFEELMNLKCDEDSARYLACRTGDPNVCKIKK
ncbi:pyruvate ferredoxin oxidoreductase [Nanoarchaeota archaeon]